MATYQRVDSRGGSNEGESLLNRLPPHSVEAELGVLGSMLLNPEVCDDVLMVLRRSEEFYVYANQLLFKHILAIHNEGKRADTTLLLDRLRKESEVEAVGGIEYLIEVVNSVPSAANAVYYAEIVRDKATLRAMIHASSEILRDAYDPSGDARELLARAEERVFKILDTNGGNELVPMHDVLSEAMSRIDLRLLKGAGIGGMETGYAELDRLTGGLHESELIIIAARPSMGKTAFSTNIAEHVAIKLNRPVLFVSLEMSKLELAERILCSSGKINGHDLRNGFISPSDQKKLVETSSKISMAPLFIDDSPSRTVTEIAATARRLKSRNGLAMVVIDYLQLIEPDNTKDPRQEQVAKIARRLKAIAREIRVPVICLAQLNRQAEATKDNRPRLSHLRESGAIEQDADVVMFVHREEYYLTTEEERARVSGEAEIIIAKQRNGPTGEIKLAWLKNYTRFENLVEHAEKYDF